MSYALPIRRHKNIEESQRGVELSLEREYTSDKVTIGSILLLIGREINQIQIHTRKLLDPQFIYDTSERKTKKQNKTNKQRRPKSARTQASTYCSLQDCGTWDIPDLQKPSKVWDLVQCLGTSSYPLPKCTTEIRIEGNFNKNTLTILKKELPFLLNWTKFFFKVFKFYKQFSLFKYEEKRIEGSPQLTPGQSWIGQVWGQYRVSSPYQTFQTVLHLVDEWYTPQSSHHEQVFSWGWYTEMRMNYPDH